MKISKKIIFILLVCFCCFSQAYRIVTLTPNLAAIVQQAGAGHDLVAVSVDTKFPAHAEHLPVVADVKSIDVEKIIQLHPDVVLAWRGGNVQPPLKKLKSLGVKVVQYRFDSFDDISDAILSVGQLAGTDLTAERSTRGFKQALARFRRDFGSKKYVSVFYQVWSHPLITLTDHTLIGQSIRLCGGRNIFSDLDQPSPSVSEEAVVARDPEVMIGNNPGWQKIWQKWTKIRAVRRHNLFTLSDDDLAQPDARMVSGINTLCHDLSLARTHLMR